MIDVEKIEDEFIENIKKKIPEFKTVDVHEPEYDDTELRKILALTPACFVMTMEETPVEEERLQNGVATLVDSKFRLLVGAQSLRSRKEGQRGCYQLLRDLRTAFEGNSFTIEEATTPSIVWYGNQYEFTFEGKVFYSIVFGFNQK